MKKLAKARLTLSVQARRTLLLDICQRRNIEACGVLLGSIDEQGNWHIEEAYPLRNIFASPAYFEFAPEELLSVELSHPGQTVGVYHSHPTGFPRASTTDRQNMQRVNQEQRIPWVWLIVSGPFDDLCAQTRQEQTVAPSMIAYHHYEHNGLQEIPIEFEPVADGERS
jgi:proteasome lid subunit RPN8/RPN11